MNKDTYQTVPVFHFSEAIKKIHTKKRLQCLIVGNFGAYNLVDEAILAGELAELAQIPNLKVTVAAEYPAEIKRLHGSVRSVSFSQIGKELKKSDFVLINGSLFTFSHIHILSLLLWKQRVFKKKMYIFGLGLSGSVNFMVKQMAYSLIKGATLVTVCNHETANLLKKKNIHVHVFKDQSFFMEPSPVTTVLQDPYFKRFYKKSRVNIGLSLHKPVSKKEEKHILSEIVTFIVKNHTYADFWFYATDHHPKRANDEEFGHLLHEDVKKKIGKDVQFHFIPTTWSPHTFFASIKIMSFLVTMCPYTALFGYRHNCNLVSIQDNNKSCGFIKSLGHDVLKIPEVTAKKLQARLT